MPNQKHFDVIIVGAGPAGLSAAIYTARAKLKTLVFEDRLGSNLKYAIKLTNYFGFPGGIAGKQLLNLGKKQAKKYGAQLRKEEVLSLRKVESLGKKHLQLKKQAEQKKFLVQTQKDYYFADHLIIATGIQIKTAGIRNENKLLGKGISTCVICDAAFFRNKKVMVVGNGDLAASEALELLNFTEKITVNLNGLKSKMSLSWKNKLVKNKINLVNRKVSQVLGTDKLEKIEYQDKEIEDYAGLFLATGTASSSDFAKSLGLESIGDAIKVDQKARTNLSGVWAAGDISGPPKQVSIAVGEGSQAAIDLIESLRGGTYLDHYEN